MFFETDVYSLYTDSRFVGALLTLLISETKAPKLGLRVLGSRIAKSPYWFEQSASSTQWIGIVNSGEVSQVVDLFDKQAKYGVWDFYGLESSFPDPGLLKGFPDLLETARIFPFVVEIDLDSILMGFTRPGLNPERLIERLRIVAPSRA